MWYALVIRRARRSVWYRMAGQSGEYRRSGTCTSGVGCRNAIPVRRKKIDARGWLVEGLYAVAVEALVGLSIREKSSCIEETLLTPSDPPASSAPPERRPSTR